MNRESYTTSHSSRAKATLCEPFLHVMSHTSHMPSCMVSYCMTIHIFSQYTYSLNTHILSPYPHTHILRLYSHVGCQKASCTLPNGIIRIFAHPIPTSIFSSRPLLSHPCSYTLLSHPCITRHHNPPPYTPKATSRSAAKLGRQHII